MPATWPGARLAKGQRGAGASSFAPKGRQHRYRFTVYILNCALGLSPWTTKKGFLQAAKGHILQQGTVTGIFG